MRRGLVGALAAIAALGVGLPALPTAVAREVGRPGCTVQCRYLAAGDEALPFGPVRSGTELDEAGGGEVAVEGERVAQAPTTHHREAGGVDERVLAFVVLAQPRQREVLILGRDPLDAHPRGSVEHVEEGHGGTVPTTATEEGPGLAPHLVAGEQGRTGVLLQQGRRVSVTVVAPVVQPDPEGRVDEDHRYTTSSMFSSTGAG